MQFKTELHAHSRDISYCSNASAEHIVKKYLAAGYDSIVLSNHFNYDTFRDRITDIPFDDEHKEEYWRAMVDWFWTGLDKLRSAAAGTPLHVIDGMEIRFTENYNDYLVFGVTREFMYKYPDMLRRGERHFKEVASPEGILFFQAHPFRFGMCVVNPSHLDGIETFNGHPGHNSNNDIAAAWAAKYGLLTSCGTDHHDESHPASCGILTDKPVRDRETLLEVLRAQSFTPFYPDNFQKK